MKKISQDNILYDKCSKSPIIFHRFNRIDTVTYRCEYCGKLVDSKKDQRMFELFNLHNTNFLKFLQALGIKR